MGFPLFPLLTLENQGLKILINMLSTNFSLFFTYFRVPFTYMYVFLLRVPAPNIRPCPWVYLIIYCIYILVHRFSPSWIKKYEKYFQTKTLPTTTTTTHTPTQMSHLKPQRTTVFPNTPKAYDLVVGHGVLQTVPDEIQRLLGSKMGQIVIITDALLHKLWGSTLVNSFQKKLGIKFRLSDLL